jgi:hypothetical protein
MLGGDSQGRGGATDSGGEFAEELRGLRAGAGNPSFRQMARASQSISHTTLHEAATGSRFPSWETTREFVKACGGDESEWRPRWERAKNAVAPDGAPAPSGQAVATGRRRRRGPLALALGLGTAGVVAAGATVLVITTTRSAEPRPSGLPTGPATPGDQSRFITDVTIPDGTVVKVNETFEKIWEIENAGRVPWRNRFLQRQDAPVSFGACRTVDRVPVGDTLPNERVKISVSVTAPSTPGICLVKWKMVDEHGRQLFPTSRPVFFLVRVVKPAKTSRQ